MKKNIIVIATIGMLLLSCFMITPVLGSSGGDTIYVDDDSTYPGNGTLLWPYRYIWQSIENASAGDTIYVFNGTYYENVIVNKSISLIGEDRDITIIDGGGSGHVIDITVDYVNISGFTIQNSGSGPSNWYNAGINVSSDYNNLSGNNITDNNCGIFLNHLSNTVISGNDIVDNYYYGIVLNDSSNNNISENIIITEYDGLALVISSNNSIVGNTIKGNAFGLDVLFYSCDNIIAGNNITENGAAGIELWNSSNNNIVSGNDITSNGFGCSPGFGAGIMIEELSSGNLFYENNIGNNTHYGIILDESSDENTFYHNNFNNTENANDSGDNNTFDNGAEGNYWHDYDGIDEDGDRIGETPYNISGGTNNDSYPLMFPYGELPPVADFTRIVDETTVTFDASSSYDRDGEIVNYTWEFGDGTNLTSKDAVIIEHSYDKDYKTYKVNLTVIDDSGKSSDIFSMNVTTNDTTAPVTVELVKPVKGLYINGKLIRNRLFRMALIIGDITIEVDASDENGSGIERVNFYIDSFRNRGEPVANDTTAPYTYNWTKTRLFSFFHIHVLKVEAIDNAGNSKITPIMIVRKIL